MTKKSDKLQSKGFLKFLGTAGARFVMIKQLRSSAGLWFCYGNTNICIDPGPGAIVRVNHTRPALDPGGLDAIILTHQHLDHANDVNVMVEAMTEGGHRKRGVLFAPSDALGKDGVVFRYVQKFPETIVTLREGTYRVADVEFSVPLRNPHPVETYGLKFHVGGQRIAIVSDTGYDARILEAYGDATVLVLNVVFARKRPGYDHLSLEEACELVRGIKPKLAIFTHFGMTMLRAKPHQTEERVRNQTGLPIRFAYDGMIVPLPYRQARAKKESS